MNMYELAQYWEGKYEGLKQQYRMLEMENQMFKSGQLVEENRRLKMLLEYYLKENFPFCTSEYLQGFGDGFFKRPYKTVAKYKEQKENERKEIH